MKGVAAKLAEQLREEMKGKRWLDVSKDQAAKYAVSNDALITAVRILAMEDNLVVEFVKIRPGMTRKVLMVKDFTGQDLIDIRSQYK